MSRAGRDGPDSPPRWAEKLLGRLLDDANRDAILGDLAEEFQQGLRTGGRSAARRWYVWEALRSIPAALRSRWFGRPASSFTQVLADLRWDLGYAVRTLLPRPAFLVGVLSLGLAIGATTAVYSTVDWLLDRAPGGVVRPEEVVGLHVMDRSRLDLGSFGFNYAQYQAMEPMQDAFTEIAAFAKIASNLSTEDRAEPVVLEFASGTYFQLLGVRPHLGRVFGPEDDVRGGEPVAVLSYGLWQSRFGGDPGIVDDWVRLDGTRTRVVGVLPQTFEGLNLDWNGPTSLWVPMESAEALGVGGMLRGTASFIRILGRLRPDTDINVAAERAQRWLPELPPLTALMEDADTVAVEQAAYQRIARREAATGFLGPLLVVCGLVLLAAGFNLANFFLGRAALRSTEMGVRASLGAGRGRLTRQLLAEAGLLGICAAIAAGLIGWWLASALAPWPYAYLGLSFRTTPLTTDAAADGHIVSLALALGFLVSIVFGLLPMLAALKSPMALIRGTVPRWSWGGVNPNGRQSVLAVQVALAVVLAVVAGLHARSFANIAGAEQEFREPESVLIARVVPNRGLPREQGDAFHDGLMERIADLPGVRAVGIGWNSPFNQGRSTLSLPGAPDVAIEAGSAAAGPGFFEATQTPFVAGRPFRDYTEDADGIILNSVAAQRLWPGQDPIGQPVMIGPEEKRVVGIVARQRCLTALGEPEACAWRLFTRAGSPGYLRIRADGDPLELVPQVRAIVFDLDRDASLAQEELLADYLAGLNGRQRLAAAVSSGLALFAILLLAVGCVSLFLAMVRDSRRELSIRMALGATGPRIVRRITGQGLLVVSVGVVLGLGAASYVARLIASELHEVSPHDLLTLAVVSVLVLGVGVGSVALASLEAVRTEPAVHLKSE